MPHHLHLPAYDAVLQDFLDGPQQYGSVELTGEPVWTELWAHRSRDPNHSSRAYVVTHGLPAGARV